MIFQDLIYNISTDVTNKTMYIVSIKGFVLFKVFKTVCLSVMMDIYLCTGIACHEIKMTCIIN